ncbi:MAG: molecular chaperone DnaK, partial [Faecalibacillus sp.]
EEAIREAKMYESQDNQLKERLIFKNDAENLIIQVENGLVNHKKDMDKNLRKQIKNELSSFKKMTKKFDYEKAPDSDFQQVRDAKNNLEHLSQSIIL